jgi:hypothetical protein
VPTASRPAAQLDPPGGYRAEAVQVVSGCPGLVPRAVRGRFGPLGQPARGARVLFAAPSAVPTAVGPRVPFEDVLSIAPEETINDVNWLGMVNADHACSPFTKNVPGEPPDETLERRNRA